MENINNPLVDEVLDDFVEFSYLENYKLIRAINEEFFEEAACIRDMITLTTNHVKEVLFMLTEIDMCEVIDQESKYIHNQVNENFDNIKRQINQRLRDADL